MEPIQEFWLNNRPFLGAIVFLYGALIGSFLNVAILRLPVMMKRAWKSACYEELEIENPETPAEETFNLVFPNSHCPNCQHAIRWWENIPLISYLFLKGKCSSCKTSISLRYPLVEFFTAVATLTVIWNLGFTVQGLLGVLLTWALIVLAVIDLDEQLLLDALTLPTLWVGLLINLFGVFCPLPDAVIGAMVGYLSLWLFFWVFYLLTGKQGMGYGDFKLFAALGAWLGWYSLPMILIMSSVTGSIIGILLIITRKQDKQTPIPFGPFLAVAGWVTLLWGHQLNHLIYGFSF